MQSIPVHQAIGHVPVHDVTRILPGISKGPAFKKGHIVSAQDIETLLDMGKSHIFISVKPFQSLHVGIVTTGSEVFPGRIKDPFGPVVKKKFNGLGSRSVHQIFIIKRRKRND